MGDIDMDTQLEAWLQRLEEPAEVTELTNVTVEEFETLLEENEYR